MNTTELEVKDKTNPNEDIKIAPFRKNIRKTSPHKHNKYLEIIYLTKGEGSHTIDTKEYDITTPIVFIIRKEQVPFLGHSGRTRRICPDHQKTIY